MGPHTREAAAPENWRPLFLLLLVCGVTALKLLLLPAYRSTDFEVHRNWLAVTGTLSLSQWYTDSTSQWTLDYPPLFAWFEWGLSRLAPLADPEMLTVQEEPYASYATVVFQRLTVIAADSVLVGSVHLWCRRMPLDRYLATTVLTLASPGLLMVDHVHFQYNGLLLGLLVLSLTLVRDGHDLAGGLAFAVLLNMKHLFAYAAPAYFVYLLRHYCWGGGWRGLRNLLVLGGGVLAVCAASMGPFAAMGQMGQLLGRLFPFGRGLCHAYWAPNWWALYSAVDKVLAFAFRAGGLQTAASEVGPGGNTASGLVGAGVFVVLPQVPPWATLLLVLLTTAPALVALWRRPSPRLFVHAVAFSNLCGFTFGYHVHEKALLHVTLPLALVAAESWGGACDLVLSSAIAHAAILPLLFGAREYPLKALLALLYTPAALHLLRHVVPHPATKGGSSSSRVQGGVRGAAGVPPLLPVAGPAAAAYLLGLPLVEALRSVVLPAMLGGRLPFLPLMLTSCYCAVGVVCLWLQHTLGWLAKTYEA